MSHQDGQLERDLFGEPEPPYESDQSDISDTPPAVELGRHPSNTEDLRIPDIYPQWYQGSSLQTNLVHNYHRALGGEQRSLPLRLEADFGTPSANTVSAPSVPTEAAGQRLLPSTSKAAHSS